MSTPIEDAALWTLHRETRREMQRRGHCPRCAEQIAFAATDVAEGKAPRKPELCDRCKRVHEARRQAA